MSRPVITAVVAAAAGLLLAAPASAQTVNCGQVITSDTTLSNDLVDCPKDGLVIGRSGITVDLNGHTITGRYDGEEFCEANCVYGRHGIDNRGGYDRITIRDGTINQFTHGIYLFGSHGSRVRDVTYPGTGPQYYDRSGVFLLRSTNNTIRNVAIYRAEPGILLFDSDRNTIASSTANGGTSMRQGDGMLLAAGSDNNRIVDTELTGDWLGLNVVDSNRNRFARISTSSYVGSHLYGDRNVIVDSDLGGGRQEAVTVRGDRNHVLRNEMTGNWGVYLEDGSRNVIEANTSSYGGILVARGDRNFVRANTVQGAGLHIRPPATRTQLRANFVTGAQDGILIEAPSTVVGDNVANNNLNLGINAVAGTIDAGGNLASGNGNPLQCVNVFCQATAP